MYFDFEMTVETMSWRNVPEDAEKRAKIMDEIEKAARKAAEEAAAANGISIQTLARPFK